MSYVHQFFRHVCQFFPQPLTLKIWWYYGLKVFLLSTFMYCFIYIYTVMLGLGFGLGLGPALRTNAQVLGLVQGHKLKSLALALAL